MARLSDVAFDVLTQVHELIGGRSRRRMNCSCNRVTSQRHADQALKESIVQLPAQPKSLGHCTGKLPANKGYSKPPCGPYHQEYHQAARRVKPARFVNCRPDREGPNSAGLWPLAVFA